MASACSRAEEATYTVELLGPANAFVGATSVSLLLRDREVAKAAIPASGAFSLEVPGLDPTVERATIFTVRALAADNRVVAFGQSPEVEVLTQNQVLRVFVQPPGTFARAQDLATKLINNFLVTAEILPQSPLGLNMTVPLFGLGRTETGGLASLLYVYDPITHRVQEIGRTRFGRSGVTAVARAGGLVVLFGGYGTPIFAEGEKTNAQIEFFAPSRSTFATFQNLQQPGSITADPMHARARAAVALAVQKRLYIGGVDDANAPLKTVMSVDESTGGNTATAAYTPMAAARVDHTATSDPTSVLAGDFTDSSGRVLVYGGNSEGPVAEVLIARTSEWRPAILPAGPTGTARSQHQAVLLPSAADPKVSQVLILGGGDAMGAARGDSVLCTPSTLTCEPGPITLRTPRKDFTVFKVRNDLVVAGGIGPDGQPVAKAEIYDLATLAFVAEVDAVARSGAGASTLPNASTVLIGGVGVGGAPATAVEIYQPRRTL
ncbi:MAG TPA: kelch repeat-containing protein [Polyangia bacterium]